MYIRVMEFTEFKLPLALLPARLQGRCPLGIMQFTCFDLLQLNILLSSSIYINGSLRITSFYIIETARRPWFMMGNERHTRGITSIIISLICN